MISRRATRFAALCVTAPLMSALGQKRTLGKVRLMSALPPKADIGTQSWNVRFVPKADKVHRNKKWPLFDHIVDGPRVLVARSAIGG
jgi:hypothetical protein